MSCRAHAPVLSGRRLASGLFLLSCLLAGLLLTGRSQAAGFIQLNVPAQGDEPALSGAVWYPCQAPTVHLMIRLVALDVSPDCPLTGPPKGLIVFSHGSGGTYLGHADSAIALAEAGFIVATINHPGDTAGDTGQRLRLTSLTRRPVDIGRLIDHLLDASPYREVIDPARIGFFGFSRGGFTGLALAGAEPDFDAARTTVCGRSWFSLPCLVLTLSSAPEHAPLRDRRIRAAVIADPLALGFPPDHVREIGIPIQLWRSERGGDGVEPIDVEVLVPDLPPGSSYQVVPGSGHFAFLAPCSPELARVVPDDICVDEGDFDRVAFHQRFNASMVTFFQATLGPARP